VGIKNRQAIFRDRRLRRKTVLEAKVHRNRLLEKEEEEKEEEEV
jgi:hypothetical protein